MKSPLDFAAATHARRTWIVRSVAAIVSVLLTGLSAASADDRSLQREALRPIERALEALQITDYRIYQDGAEVVLVLHRPSTQFDKGDGKGLVITVTPFKWTDQPQQWYQIEAPNLYSLRQCDHPNAARRVLLEAPFKTGTDVQFYCNPNVGNVSARMAIPAEGGKVSSSLLSSCLTQIVNSVDGIAPVIERSMESGLIDWPSDDEGPKEPTGFLSVRGTEEKEIQIGWAPWFEQSVLASTAISSDPIWRKFTAADDEERERMGYWLAREAVGDTNRSTYAAWMTGSNYLEQHYPPFAIRFWGPQGTTVSASMHINGFTAPVTASTVIDSMGFKEVDLLPDWNADALLELEAPKQVTVTYTVTCGDQNSSGSATLELQPVSVIDPALPLVSVAQAVNEDHPWVRGIISEARALGISDSLGASKDMSFNEGVRQIYSVWKALRNRGISYVNIAPHDGRGNGPSQTVRLFHDAIREESANCADGSAAIASVLRKLGFEVHLMYPPGHVLLAIYFDNPGDTHHWMFLETTMLGDVDAEPKGTSAVSEATGLIPVQSRGEDWDNFVAACEAGLDQAGSDPPRVSIDKLRQMGLRPIPVLASKVGSLPAPMPAQKLQSIRDAKREVAQREREKMNALLKCIPEVAPVPYRSMDEARRDIETVETSPDALGRLLAAVSGDSLRARAARAHSLLEKRCAKLNRALLSRFKILTDQAEETFGVAGYPWDIEQTPTKEPGTIRVNIVPHDHSISDSWIDLHETPEGWFVTDKSLSSSDAQAYVLGTAYFFSVCKGKPDMFDPVMHELCAKVEAGKYRSYADADADFKRSLTSFVTSHSSEPSSTDPKPVSSSPAAPTTPAHRADAPAADGAAVEVTDLLPGSGVAATKGVTVRYHYICSLPDGHVIFDSRPSGKTRTRVVGDSVAPVGLSEGLVGARKGMHRRLRIPPNLAYGPAGLAPGIPPNATIIIDLFVEEVGGR